MLISWKTGRWKELSCITIRAGPRVSVFEFVRVSQNQPMAEVMADQLVDARAWTVVFPCFMMQDSSPARATLEIGVMPLEFERKGPTGIR